MSRVNLGRPPEVPIPRPVKQPEPQEKLVKPAEPPSKKPHELIDKISVINFRPHPFVINNALRGAP